MANNTIREYFYHFIDENDQNSPLACQGHLPEYIIMLKIFFMRSNILSNESYQF